MLFPDVGLEHGEKKKMQWPSTIMVAEAISLSTCGGLKATYPEREKYFWDKRNYIMYWRFSMSPGSKVCNNKESITIASSTKVGV